MKALIEFADSIWLKIIFDFTLRRSDDASSLSFVLAHRCGVREVMLLQATAHYSVPLRTRRPEKCNHELVSKLVM
jgi:hypothetical protein